MRLPARTKNGIAIIEKESSAVNILCATATRGTSEIKNVSIAEIPRQADTGTPIITSTAKDPNMIKGIIFLLLHTNTIRQPF